MAKKIAASAAVVVQIDVGCNDHAGRADARVARGLLVLADRVEVAAEDRAVEDHPT